MEIVSLRDHLDQLHAHDEGEDHPGNGDNDRFGKILDHVLQALSGYDDELVSKVMGGLCWALETMDPKEAEEVWENY